MPRKATNLAFVVYAAARLGDGVVDDAKSALVVRLVQVHVHPSAVLLVPLLVGILSALLQHDVLLQRSSESIPWQSTWE